MKPVLMKLDVVPCRFVKRLKRFVALVEVNGEIRKALLTNTGRLKEFIVPGRRAFCTPKTGGKTDFVLRAFEDLEGKGAVIDVRTQAKAFERAVELGLIPPAEELLDKAEGNYGRQIAPRSGKRAMIFFVGALPGVTKFKPYGEGDREIERLLNEAKKTGVKIHAIGISPFPAGKW